MVQSRLVTIFVCFLLCSSPAQALTINPFVVGSFKEIKNQYRDKPYVLIFWSESCGYCMKELAMFGRLQKEFPEVTLITVATDSFLEEETVQQVITGSGLELEQAWVFAEQFPETIYMDIHKGWRGELPVTHFFNRQNIEDRHLGIIDENWLTKWLTEQSQPH